MSTDPSVIAALEAAVGAAPGNAALRVHLASLLVLGLVLWAGIPRFGRYAEKTDREIPVIRLTTRSS